MSADGLRLIDLDLRRWLDAKVCGRLRAGNDAHALWVGDDWDGFKGKSQELSAKGLRLAKMEVYGPSIS